MKNNKKMKGFEWLKTLPKKRQKQFKKSVHYCNSSGILILNHLLNSTITFESFIARSGVVIMGKYKDYFFELYKKGSPN